MYIYIYIYVYVYTYIYIYICLVVDFVRCYVFICLVVSLLSSYCLEAEGLLVHELDEPLDLLPQGLLYYYYAILHESIAITTITNM